MLDFLESEKLNVLNKTELDEVDRAFELDALRVLAARYLLRNEDNEIIESPKELFERIAVLVAIGDIIHDARIFSKKWFTYERDTNLFIAQDSFKIGRYELNQYHKEALWRAWKELRTQGQIADASVITKLFEEGGFDEYEINVKEYFDLMVSRDFLPNTPTIMNAGAKLGQLSACFVLDVEDSMESVMKTATDAAMIFKSGGGVGINYSKLRPEGDIVASTSGVASGPVSFMRIIDAVTDVVKQGGKRRGANMGIISSSHPDLEKFIMAKTQPGVLENFNVSVGVLADFWESVTNQQQTAFELINPRTCAVQGARFGRNILEQIAQCAWKSAEPGLVFFDNINEFNPLISLKGPLNSTNPCSEQSLYPYESCNLGSINLANFVEDGKFNWMGYRRCIKLATRFLDNVIDMNKYPLARIDEETKKTRRIGLGIMGLADALFAMRLRYDSKKGYDMMSFLAEALTYESMSESVLLSEERGEFPALSKLVSYVIPVKGAHDAGKRMYDWGALSERIARDGIRNAWTTTIAPTGTLSMLAGCSSGMEPVFALSFEKQVTVGKFLNTNKHFAPGCAPEVMQQVIENYGSCQGLENFSMETQDVFRTAMDIHYTDHIMAESVWQRWIANAISKTINMAKDATVEDIKRAYLLAHEMGLKGVTVYRDESRATQVLHVKNEDKSRKFKVEPSAAFREYAATFIKQDYLRDEIGQVLEPEKARIIPMVGGLWIGSATATNTAMIGLATSSMVDFCPGCKSSLVRAEGCMKCPGCGWSACMS
jgi:ribonucleoside-diphosphate reductase alpha chain